MVSTSVAGQGRQHLRWGKQFRVANAAADDDPLLIHHILIDQDRPVRRQPDRGDSAILHAGQRNRGVHRSERNLAGVKMFAHDAVDVGAGGRQHDARRVPYSVGPLGFHDDTVRRDVQADVVLLAEGGGIGEVGVDLTDPQPVGARLLDVLTNGVGDQARRVVNRNEPQFSQFHTVHTDHAFGSIITPRYRVARRRSPAAAGRRR